jgi:serine/threonine protein kinase/cytochrome c-type biogenesis protein CcmH/NrfG
MVSRAGATLTHYRLVERIGEGGMGVVWRAVDTRLGRDVAIKFLPDALRRDPKRLADFQREARLIASLNHPNIVTIHSVEEAEGDRFFTMEFVRGRTLADLISAAGLPLERFLEIAIPITDAIGAAHERGIIHGDLKPSNVMVSDEGRVKVLDFGLARPERKALLPEGPESPTASFTEDGGLRGTLAYMSPEQVQGRVFDHRSDIFSLGILFYEMLTGRRPFTGPSAADLIASLLKDRPAPITAIQGGLPPRLDALVGRCLEKDSGRRIQSVLDLRHDLEDLRSGAATAGADILQSIAVLAFADMSPEKDQDYFCEGVAEEIINALSRIKDLRVASRTSAFQFRGAPLDSRAIGRRLEVSHLLEGSVRKSGTRLRITVELIDVAGGYQIWSERYDRDMQDIFAIQEEIAQNIVQKLQLKPGPQEMDTLRKAPAADVWAYDFYLRGRKYFYQYSRKGMEFALQMFQRASEIDPNYALAYAGMADCYSYLYTNVERSQARLEQAVSASRRALEADAGLAEAHSASAVALSVSRRDAEAEAAFETAIRLNPALFEAHYFYARHCFVRGELEKATRLYERAWRLRPEDYQSPLLIGQIYADLSREADALDARRRGVRLAEERLRLAPDDVRALYMGANGLVAMGERERGLEWAGRALALEPEDPMLLYNVGCIRSLAGEIDGAIDCLEKSIKNGFAFKGYLGKDSNLDPLRARPRFLKLMETWGDDDP